MPLMRCSLMLAHCQSRVNILLGHAWFIVQIFVYLACSFLSIGLLSQPWSPKENPSCAGCANEQAADHRIPKKLRLSPPRSNKGSGRLCLHFLQAIRSVHSSAKKRRSSPLCRGRPPWQRDEWDPWASIIKRAASDKSKGHYAGPCGMTPNILYHLADIRDIISPMNGPFHSYKPDLTAL